MLPRYSGAPGRSFLVLSAVLALIAGALLPLGPVPAARAAVITPSRVRFNTTANGDIAIVSNAIMTCPDSAPNCAAARNGTASPASQNNNNSYLMQWLDIDGDPTTFNSSSATLTLPPGGEVLFAGLYWGAISLTTTAKQVKFGRPGLPYTTVQGAIIGSTSYPQQPRFAYHAFADVTALVQATGNGVYTVADVDAFRNWENVHGGWALAIVFRDPAAPPRDLTVFDVFAEVNTASPLVNFPVSGFRAPPAGPVNARLGIVGYDGDLGSTGPRLSVNNVALVNAANPANNAWNASISRFGATVVDRNPAYLNNFGFDADLFDVPAGTIANNATTATISQSTTGEAYFPGVVTIAIDVVNPDLRTTKSVVDLNGGEAHPGDVLEYSFVVNNEGDDAAVQSVLSDLIPDGTTFVPGSLSIVAGANAGGKSDAVGDDQAEYVAAQPRRIVARLGDGASGTTGGTLAIGATTTVRFRVRVDLVAADGQILTNQAELEYFGQTTGQRLTNISNLVSVPVVNRADLQVTKTNGVTQVTPGAQVQYSIVVGNLGPEGSRGTRVEDDVPALLTGVTWTCSATTAGSVCGSPSGRGNTIDTSADLPAGGSVTYLVSGTLSPDASGTLANTARATPPQGVTDPNPTAAVSTDSDTIVPQADVELFKTLSDSTPQVGDQVTFNILVRNNGPSPASLVQVRDELPSQLAFVSAAASQGTFNPTTEEWNVGALAVDGQATLAIVATVNDTPFTNTAETFGQSPPDPTPENNQRSVTFNQPRVDLEVSKTADRSVVGVGEPVTFTIEVLNNGPDVATNVTGSDVLPAGLEFVSAGPGYNSANGSFNLGPLAVGARATLQITARVTQAGPLNNTVQVQAQGQTDPVAGNNSAETSIAGEASDLSITKVASNTRTIPGEAYTFTIVVTNNGPSDASGIQVSDPPPSGARLISSATSQGSYSAATGVWTVGGLAVGDSASLDLEVVDQSLDPYVNTASIAAADQPDPNAANNQASVTITTPPDLRLSKTTGASQAVLGGVLVYDLSFTNNGTVAADEVLLTEEVPANTTFVAAQSDAGWSCADGSPATTECRLSLGTIAAGASGTRRFAIRVAGTLPPGVIQIDNRAVLGSEALGGVDPTPSDNADDEQTLFDPTAVTVERFTAVRNGSTIVLEWQTATELNTRQFRLLRSDTGSRDDAVGIAEVDARGVGGRGAAYRYVDTGARAGIRYTYFLDEQETDGSINQVARVTLQAFRLLLPTARR